MQRKNFALIALAAALTLSGCATSMTEAQRNTMIGVGVGALTGAAIAKSTGGKAGQGALIGAAVIGTGTYLWSANMERQRKELEAATQGTGVTVSRTSNNQLLMAIPSDISFDSNSAYIKSQFHPVLNSFVTSLRNNPQTEVIIVGHTDSTGGAHINDPLSLNRANAARDYIFSKNVQGPRIQTEGRGSREPVASNTTAAGRAQNRRIEIFIAQAQ